MILLLDNYDSFVFNLARYFQRLGQTTEVVRSDAIDAADVRRMDPQAVVISPGPCTPHEAGCSLDVVRQLHEEIPMLGVCLGHQVICEALGGRVVRAPEPMHGRTSAIVHNQQGVFAEIASPLAVCRYHSLVVDESTLPACLTATAHTRDGVLMAVAHQMLPIVGVQFHPEAVLTDSGYTLLANFLRMAGIEVTETIPNIDQERVVPGTPEAANPDVPITF